MTKQSQNTDRKQAYKNSAIESSSPPRHSSIQLVSSVFLVTILLAATSLHAADLKNEPVQPIPTFIELDAAKVALGEKLFHDPLLSRNNKLSCASCHPIDTYGTIPHQVHSLPGVSGKAEPINIPSVFNSGLNFIQFWDGRAKSLEAQIDGPLHNKNEMGMDWKEVLARLDKHEEYRKIISDIYGTAPNVRNIKDAIATYERSLITPDSPFDRYLRGEKTAVSAQVKRGYSYFKKYGCISCHQGVNLGGNMFQTFGVVKNYFKDHSTITKQDLGRFNVTGNPEDKHVFRVPSLRNVADTAPYFHDGSAKTLQEAIKIMADYQLGRDLSDEKLQAIEAFLHSLSGSYKKVVAHEE